MRSHNFKCQYSNFWKLSLTSINTHFRNIFCISSIPPSSTSLWAQLMYYIIFYSFKNGPSPCNIGEIEEVWFRGYGLVPSNLLHEPNACMLPSGQGILVAPKDHGGGLVPKISTTKKFLCFGYLWPKVSNLNHFFL